MSPVEEKTALRKQAAELTEPSPINEMRLMRARPLFEGDVGEDDERRGELPDDPEEEEEEEPAAHHERPTSPSLSELTRSPSPSSPPQAAASQGLSSGEQTRAFEIEHLEEQGQAESPNGALHSTANVEAPNPADSVTSQLQRQGERSQDPHEEYSN